MNVALKLWVVVLIIVILLAAVPGGAHDPPSIKGMLDPDANERGFTIGGLLEMNIRQLARGPLSPQMLSRVSDDVHRPPHRGVQLELLCPGDFGATIHFRW
jgi:hypothetical protein